MAKKAWPDWDVYKRDNLTCVYCDLDGGEKFSVFRQMVIDHLVPTSRGGDDTPENKVVSCYRCNTLKGAYDPRPGAQDKKQQIENVIKFLDLKNSEEQKDFELMREEMNKQPNS